MKRGVWILLLAVFVFTAGACAAETRDFVKSAQYTNYAPGEVLVVLKNQIGSLSARSLAGAAGKNYVAGVAALAAAEALHTYDALSVVSGEIFVLMKSAAKNTEDLIAELKKNPNVVSASPNYRIHAFANEPNDPYYRDGRLWGLKKIRANEVWETTTGGSGVHVAVVDTGVQYTHEDLADNVNMELSRNFVNPNGSTTPVEDGNFLDGQGHGTHVAGTVAAVGDNNRGVVGVNWQARIISLKVLGNDGMGWTSWNVAAVNYLVRLLNGNPGLHVPAANFSLGGWQIEDPEVVKSDAEWRAFKALDDLNRTVIVVAAGNEAHEVGAPAPNTIEELEIPGGGYVYPASFTGLNNMIVVGAIGQDNTAGYFSNWSSEAVHLAAPGVSIWSTYPTGAGYAPNDGTSMAAPHVAGAVALIASVNSNLEAGQLKSLLCDNANARVNPEQLLPGAPEPQRVRDKKLSKYGLLDVKAALDAAQGAEPSVYVEEITVTPTLLDLTVGRTQALSVTVLPDNASDKRVSWTSDSPGVAEVDSTGQVTGKSAGETFITVRALGAEGDRDISARVNVSVTAGGGPGPGPEPEPDPDPDPDPDPVPTPDPSAPLPINRAPDVSARLDEINATLLAEGSGVNFVGSNNLANYVPLQAGEGVVTYISEARFSLSDAPVLSRGYAATTDYAPLIEVDVSGAGNVALVPIRVQYSLSRSEMNDIFGQEIALAILSNPVYNASALFDKLSLRSEISGALSTLVPGMLSPATALNLGLLNLTGGERLTVTFYLLAADTVGAPRLDKTQLIVPDGTQDGVAGTLVWLVKQVSVPQTNSSGGGGGCNVLSGVLAASLLALAAKFAMGGS